MAGRTRGPYHTLRRSHTKGSDTLSGVPAEEVLYPATWWGTMLFACYTGDAYLSEWPQTLDNLAAPNAGKLIPRTRSRTGYTGSQSSQESPIPEISSPRSTTAQAEAVWQMNLKQTMAHARKVMDPKFNKVFVYEHCLPFDVTRPTMKHQASAIRV